MATEDLGKTVVLSEELVLRSVRDDRQFFACLPDGSGLRLSQSAFNDRAKQPSVDRLALCTAGPESCLKTASDGLVAVCAGDIRALQTIQTLDHKQRPVATHAVDVIHDPLEDNYAHALVCSAPAIESEGAFRKLKEALCRLAERRGWVCLPESMRSPG